MRKALSFLFLFLATFFMTAQAASFPAAPVHPTVDTAVAASLFRLSPKAIEKATGEKLPWYQKLSLKIIQKKLQKGAKGEVQPVSQSTKVLSVLSLIGGVLAVASLFIGSGVLFIIAVLTGIITGIIALSGNPNRGNKHRTMAILGIVLSGIMILLILAALIAWAAAWN